MPTAAAAEKANERRMIPGSSTKGTPSKGAATIAPSSSAGAEGLYSASKREVRE